MTPASSPPPSRPARPEPHPETPEREEPSPSPPPGEAGEGEDGELVEEEPGAVP